MMDLKIAVQRLASQQLAQPVFQSPVEVVRWMGAIQAQDYLGSLWAVGCRLPGSTEQDIERAIAARTILRTWPMRGTIHFVPAEDAMWMLAFMAPRALGRLQNVYRKAGLDEAVFDRSRAVITRALEGGRQLQRRALYDRLEADGIATANSRGLHILGYWAHQGLICFGARDGRQPTFTLLEEWAPNSRRLAGEEALAEIALRYFRSHGPATIQDFMWWSGLLKTEAQAGLDAASVQLTGEPFGGSTYWWSDAAVNAAPDSPRAYLLPPYDEYMVGYKDRSAALDPEYEWLQDAQRHLSSIVVIDGVVTGAWKRKLEKGAVRLEPNFARTLTSVENEAFEAAARRYAEFLGKPAVLA